MKKLETFIFVHDQNIIVDFEEKQKFKSLGDLKYVLVGMGNYDKVENNQKVIICQKYDNHMEDFPKMTSYTGWYILWKYNLINSEYVNLFEYDVNCSDNFHEIVLSKLTSDVDCVSYFPMNLSDPVYIKMRQYVNELINSIKQKTKVDIDQIINEKIKNDYFSFWGSSSNSTWKVSVWKNYMEWFDQFVDDILDSNFCGHMHERSISFFHFIFNCKVIDIKNIMTHFQFNTHGTSPLAKDRFNQLYKNLF